MPDHAAGYCIRTQPKGNGCVALSSRAVLSDGQLFVVVNQKVSLQRISFKRSFGVLKAVQRGSACKGSPEVLLLTRAAHDEAMAMLFERSDLPMQAHATSFSALLIHHSTSHPETHPSQGSQAGPADSIGRDRPLHPARKTSLGHLIATPGGTPSKGSSNVDAKRRLGFGIDSDKPGGSKGRGGISKNRSTACTAWSVVLPAHWVMPVWLAMVAAGATVAGQEEMGWVAQAQGRPSFPADFPDTAAGAAWLRRMHAEAAAADSKR